MKREEKFSWPIFLGSMLALCFLCCGGCSLPLYVFPQVSESQAEELRQDADRLSEKYKATPIDRSRLPEIPASDWTPAIRSLNPTRVELIHNELFVTFSHYMALGRGIVIVPDGVERPWPHGNLEYQRLHPRVYRYVAWWD